MTDYTKLQARCQRGEGRIADANNLLAECYGALGRLIAERDQLHAELKGLRTGFDAQNEVIVGLRVDADRYQWLRDRASVILSEEVGFTAESGQRIYSTMPTQRELDSAIDAAMGKGGEA
ncbi:hypothetical protein BK645_10135 [Pseudomonas protegens]|uniref:hypothetical protein n=1 Tax=Pseudomonas protegens TaxID=380021 RepID=UPI00037871FC|nr:hypothetical protein [Pseudomonas protegens]ROM29319.1 hypothetical protein BK645_10135 [Pseudomonas protegens]ROM36952.1 hypothetical protein BK646_18180 [Pseudomonas protegens]